MLFIPVFLYSYNSRSQYISLERGVREHTSRGKIISFLVLNSCIKSGYLTLEHYINTSKFQKIFRDNCHKIARLKDESINIHITL